MPAKKAARKAEKKAERSPDMGTVWKWVFVVAALVSAVAVDGEVGVEARQQHGVVGGDARSHRRERREPGQTHGRMIIQAR